MSVNVFAHRQSSHARVGRRRLMQPRTYRPALEPLEGRNLLAVTGMISGTVTADGIGIDHAEVALYESTRDMATVIATTTADASGEFEFDYEADEASILYIIAADGNLTDSQLLLMGVVGEAGADPLDTVHVNELTTVATVYSLSQFLHGTEIYGPSPGLNIAAATTFNLVDAETGTPGEVISNFNNGQTLAEYGRSTQALTTLNTLANMVTVCAADGGLACDEFFALATPAGEVAPTNTIEAIHNIAQNPVNVVKLDNEALYEFASHGTTYSPVLPSAPDGWILALHFTEGGFNGPGRIAFDAEGNVWSNNNFQLHPSSSTNGGKNIVVLSPLGEPILGSPIYGLGLNGSGYGTAVAPDGSVWIASFSNSGISKFSADGKPELIIKSKFVRDADDPKVKIPTLNSPMGITFDQDGNLWVPNSGALGDNNDTGSVTVYLGGDPKQFVTLKDDNIDKPFNIAIDEQGRAWVSNSPQPGGSVVVLELVDDQITIVHPRIETDALSKPIDDPTVLPHSDFFTPRTIAIDTGGNAWINNFEAPFVTFIDGDTFHARDIHIPGLLGGWGLSVDASDRIWIADNDPLLGPRIHVLDGTNPHSGNQISKFTNPALQILTAVQIDQSGNVWAVDNWSLESRPGAIVGGDGLVEFIGLGTPVTTPLIGPPEAPNGSDADLADAAVTVGQTDLTPPLLDFVRANGKAKRRVTSVPGQSQRDDTAAVASVLASAKKSDHANLARALKQAQAEENSLRHGESSLPDHIDQVFTDVDDLAIGIDDLTRMPWETD